MYVINAIDFFLALYVLRFPIVVTSNVKKTINIEKEDEKKKMEEKMKKKHECD